ncbi:LmeA family phospholipid-binding protein [Curtobacterium flaccumfaciens]|nr:LmeA family phospholipid-binding protein [Curtobacterium flaccumfaciens]
MLIVVVVVLAALVVIAEFVLRGVVDRIIAQQVEQSLPSGATGDVQAHAKGVVIPQLIGGRLDEVEISSKKLTIDGIPLAADVTARDVPVDGKGDVHDVDGHVTLAAGSVKDLAKYSPLFDRLSLVDGGVELSGETAVLGYDITYAARGHVVAQEDGKGITITPKTVRITNSALGLKVDSIPGVTNVPVQVCTAQFLPSQLASPLARHHLVGGIGAGHGRLAAAQRGGAADGREVLVVAWRRHTAGRRGSAR